ncbi:uncharacterized protein B0I36DRAFT_348869 [Microdochium trichocladiopsis]|uniref:Uncharacterized protein n=1 Tax=Microdochium trichocladiopsis TaxID=1682393 RepID=A0A9P9BQA2_9PEZI|nr:uncharacterized protein B0I36DRAFT_348869 [Microdochium trichocladiopsis]KAH7030665.1 hypothetical protein B0I36DRAFT_348869 [Microdochium trichocladiopsis]
MMKVASLGIILGCVLFSSIAAATTTGIEKTLKTNQAGTRGASERTTSLATWMGALALPLSAPAPSPADPGGVGAVVEPAARARGVDLSYLADMVSYASGQIPQNTAFIKQTMRAIAAGQQHVEDPAVQAGIKEALAKTRSHLQNVGGALVAAVDAIKNLQSAGKGVVYSEQAAQLLQLAGQMRRMGRAAKRGLVNKSGKVRPLLENIDGGEGGNRDIDAMLKAVGLWAGSLRTVMGVVRSSGDLGQTQKNEVSAALEKVIKVARGLQKLQ